MSATAHRVFIAVACSTLLHALLLTLPAKLPRETPIPRPLEVVIAEATTADDGAPPLEQIARPRPVPPKRARRAVEPPPRPEARPRPKNVAPPSPPIPDIAPVPKPRPMPEIAQAPEAQPAPETGASAESAGEAASRQETAALARYTDLLGAALAAHRAYPRLARMRGMEGDVEMQVRIAADGRVLSARILASSGHELLDRQALAMIESAQPLPKPPAPLPGGELTVRVPVVFRLEG